MKAIAYEIIDGIKVVRAIGEPTIDPELTKREARKRLEKSEEYKTFDHAYRVCSGMIEAGEEEIAAAKIQIFKILESIIELRKSITRDNPVYFPIPGEANVDDNHADRLREALAGLKGHELLTLDGVVITDDRGRRAWAREDSGRWVYTTITRLGDPLPDGYRWSEDLDQAELVEIRDQMEEDRIEAMSVDERRARADGEIDAALDAIVRRHMRAQIKGEGASQDELRSAYEEASMRILARYKLLDGVDNGA